LDVCTVVFKPDCSMESHLVVLYQTEGTISSIALESFEKISLKALSKSYSLDDSSS
jgi:hypothetical protein